MLSIRVTEIIKYFFYFLFHIFFFSACVISFLQAAENLAPYVNSEAQTILLEKFPEGLAELEACADIGNIGCQIDNILDYGAPGLNQLSTLVPSPLDQIFDNLARHAENIGNEMKQLQPENEADQRVAQMLDCHLLNYNADEINRGIALTFGK